jgi:hypothetical protein
LRLGEGRVHRLRDSNPAGLLLAALPVQIEELLDAQRGTVLAPEAQIVGLDLCGVTHQPMVAAAAKACVKADAAHAS